MVGVLLLAGALSPAAADSATAAPGEPSPAPVVATPTATQSAVPGQEPQSESVATPGPTPEHKPDPVPEPKPEPEPVPLPPKEQAPSAAAVAPAPTGFVVKVSAEAYMFTQTTLTAWLVGEDGVGIAGKPVLVQRWDPVDKVWTPAGEYETNANGGIRHLFTVQRGLNRYRVVFEGDADFARSTSDVYDVAARRAPSVLTVGGPTSVVDEQEVAITVRWRTVDDRPITARVDLYSKVRGTDDWRLARTPLVDNGVATVRVTPRVDTVWRASGSGGVWYEPDDSPWHRIDNVPPAKPVVLPDGAPRPSITLPAQPRAVGAGMNPAVTRIPDAVWRSMVGRSWHTGCPVGRSSLRLIRMNYWGFDGYRHRGELVVRAGAAGDAVAVFRELYHGGYRVRHMYRVDRFGWSNKLQGANDYKSMAADNTSAFNCRYVVGRPGVPSPHSYGAAIDINTWENPYVSRDGTYPNSWWLSRSHPIVAWRSWSHPVVQAFTRQGFAWGGAYVDYHHFEQ